ncbi:MAG: metallophosphoesterase [Acidithiobacillus sp.]|jgi:serine/threonine protein phosphatase 1|nr:metallophosphoesterase [Acidithiobacillus sp.]
MNPRVIAHPANLQGRDFIVGDLHGHPDVLRRLMDHVAFDYDTDRLFSVGDLVDRGPNSAGALDLLEAPWFYPVLGNHDAMLLATLNLGHLRAMRREEAQRTAAYADLFARNGGWDWFRLYRTDEESCERWRSALSQVPLVRIVDPGNTAPAGRFQVLHAELAAECEDGVAVFWNDATLAEDAHPRWLEPHPVIGYDATGTWEDHLLWGRSLRYALSHEIPIVPAALSRTYVGHTITPPREGRLLQVAGHVFLDTGAAHLDQAERYRDQGLTLFCHQEQQGWMATATDMESVTLGNAPAF